jgi:hypothetical protein
MTGTYGVPVVGCKNMLTNKGDGPITIEELEVWEIVK